MPPEVPGNAVGPALPVGVSEARPQNQPHGIQEKTPGNSPKGRPQHPEKALRRIKTLYTKPKSTEKMSVAV